MGGGQSTDDVDLDRMITNISDDKETMIERGELEDWYNRHGLQFKVTT